MNRNNETPEVSHIQVGYGDRVIGEIALDAHGQPRFSGDSAGLRSLWLSVTSQPLYDGLTPAQTLARMTERMRGPTWATPLPEQGSRHG